jgi:hypothetical protein
MNRFAAAAVICLIALALAAAAPRCAAAKKSKAKKGEKKMAWTLKSNSIRNGERIPDKFTGVGADVSPELSWDAAPAGTLELVLIMDDPDAPVGLWTHWILYGMSPERVSLPENVEKKTEVKRLGVLQGMNTWPRAGYWGPMPPPGKPHRYFFKLYALDKKTGLPAGADRKQIDAAVKGHVIAEAQLMGTYSR